MNDILKTNSTPEYNIPNFNDHKRNEKIDRYIATNGAPKNKLEEDFINMITEASAMATKIENSLETPEDYIQKLINIARGGQ